MSIFEEWYKPYAHERVHWPTLGLTVPATLTREMLTLGTIAQDEETGTGEITVEVGAMPARFWRFTIKPIEGGACVIETGSGDLAEYWPSVLLVARSMFVFEQPTHQPGAKDE